MKKDLYNIDDLFYVGAITGSHGILGEVKVKVLSDKPDRLLDLNEIYLVSHDEKSIIGKYNIESCRGHENNIIKFLEINNRDQAIALKGAYVSIRSDSTYSLKDGEYFIKDLINLDAYDEDNLYLGKIEDIIDGAQNSLITIKRHNKKDLLIPATKEHTLLVDLEKKKIQFKLPKGLLEIYE